MDRLFRLIGFVLALLGGQAWAYGTVSGTSTQFCASSGQPTPSCSTTATAAAQGDVSYWASRAGPDTASYVIHNVVSTSGGNITYYHRQSLTSGTVRLFGPYGTTASGGGTVANASCSGSMCTCNSGFRPSGGSCQAYEVPEVGEVISSDASTRWTVGADGTACFDGVRAIPRTSYGAGTSDAYAVGPWYSLGSACDPNVSGSGGSLYQPPAGNSCPVGQCSGTVNGNTVCVTCSSVSSNVISSSTGSAGSTSSITTTTVNPTTGVATESTTTYTGGGGGTGSAITSPTVGGTSTKTGSVSTLGGTAAGTAGETQPLCAQFPNIPACKYNTASGGCGSFTCSGDPAVCAIAKAAHDQRCELVEGTGLDGSAKAAYDAAKNAKAEPPMPGTTSMSFTSIISQSDLLGSSCPTDTTLSIAGSTLTIPFSQLCSALQMLGAVMVGLSMLAAAFIVFRS